MKKLGLALALLLAPAADAHHAVTDAGAWRVEPRTRLGLETQVAAFLLSGVSGDWQAMVLNAEYAFTPRFSVSARVPWGRVAQAGRRVAYGLADLEVGVRWGLLRTEDGRWTLSAGLGMEAPTGDAQAGLGGGHWSVAPLLVASFKPSVQWVLFGATSAFAALGAEHHHHADPAAAHLDGSALSPHNSREWLTRLGAMYRWQRAFVSLGGELSWPLSANGYSPFLAGRAEAGLQWGDAWTLQLTTALPLWGDPRYQWKGGAEVLWRL